MVRFVVRRLLHSLLVLLGVSTVVFFLLRLVPGDPARLMAPTGTEESVAALRRELGLDKPILVQYVIFLRDLAQGNFGQSFFFKGSAIGHVIERLPKTLLLTGLALGFALAVAVPLGVLSAVKRNSVWDRGALGISIFVQSAPNFWVALVLLYLVAVRAKWLPAVGYRGVQYAILPSISLALTLVGVLTQVVRTSLVGVLETEMTQAMVARGLPLRRIVLKHGMRLISAPLLTVVGVQVGYLLGGAVVIEYIFNYPGVGLLTLNAVLRRDYPLVQAITIMASVIFVSVNFLVDLSYGAVDPRIRKQA